MSKKEKPSHLKKSVSLRIKMTEAEHKWLKLMSKRDNWSMSKHLRHTIQDDFILSCSVPLEVAVVIKKDNSKDIQTALEELGLNYFKGESDGLNALSNQVMFYLDNYDEFVDAIEQMEDLLY